MESFIHKCTPLFFHICEYMESFIQRICEWTTPFIVSLAVCRSFNEFVNERLHSFSFCIQSHVTQCSPSASVACSPSAFSSVTCAFNWTEISSVTCSPSAVNSVTCNWMQSFTTNLWMNDSIHSHSHIHTCNWMQSFITNPRLHSFTNVNEHSARVLNVFVPDFKFHVSYVWKKIINSAYNRLYGAFERPIEH